MGTLNPWNPVGHYRPVTGLPLLTTDSDRLLTTQVKKTATYLPNNGWYKTPFTFFRMMWQSPSTDITSTANPSTNPHYVLSRSTFLLNWFCGPSPNKRGRGVTLATRPHVQPRLGLSGAILRLHIRLYNMDRNNFMITWTYIRDAVKVNVLIYHKVMIVKKKQLQETVHSTLLLGCFYLLHML